MALIPCPAPACDLLLDEDDMADQMFHMISFHPEIVAERRKEAARWDGWEDA